MTSPTWYKGNLHSHTLWSDGDHYPEMVALWYRDHGYHFLSATEHDRLAAPGQPDHERWVDIETSGTGIAAFEALVERFGDEIDRRETDGGRTEVRLRSFAEVAAIADRPGEFLMIQGEELTDRYEPEPGVVEQRVAALGDADARTLLDALIGHLYPVHINVHGLVEVILPAGGESVLEVARRDFALISDEETRTGRRLLAQLNHPNFLYAISADELARIERMRLFEVYNGHELTYVDGDATHIPVDRMWDLALTTRLVELDLPPIYGIGVDDCHDYLGTSWHHGEPGRGWVCVRARDLSEEALFDALEAGDFYASSGVEIEDVTASAGGLDVRVRPVAGATQLVEFIGTRGPDVGVVLAQTTDSVASYRFTGDELYVRARVTSSLRHESEIVSSQFRRAWVQPVLGPAYAGSHRPA